MDYESPTHVSPRIRQRRRQQDTEQPQDAPNDERQQSPSPASPRSSKEKGKEKASGLQKLLSHLLLKEGVGPFLVSWATLIVAILSLVWAIMGFYTTSDASHKSLTQVALGNQINFLRACLDYPQLEFGPKNGSLTGDEGLLRRVPCEAFLRALDFDAMAQVLITPGIVPDVKDLPSPCEDEKWHIRRLVLEAQLAAGFYPHMTTARILAGAGVLIGMALFLFFVSHLCIRESAGGWGDASERERRKMQQSQISP